MDGSLVRDKVQMRQVDGRHDEGHEGIAAVVFGVGEDGDLGLEEFHLDVAGDVRVEAGEDDVAVAEFGGFAFAHDHVGDGTDGGGLFPADCVGVFLAGGAGGGADGVEDEVWVLGEEEDEALAYGAGGS